MPNSENTILSVNNLKVHFPSKRKFGQPKRWIRAVDGINFDVQNDDIQNDTLILYCPE